MVPSALQIKKMNFDVDDSVSTQLLMNLADQCIADLPSHEWMMLANILRSSGLWSMLLPQN